MQSLAVYFHYPLRSDASGCSLIGYAGIHKSVTYDYFTLFKGGYYFFFHMLAPGRSIKQRLRYASHLGIIYIKYYFPYLCTAGLPGENNISALFFEIIHEKLYLCAFAGTVRSLYGNKFSPHFKHSLMLYYNI